MINYAHRGSSEYAPENTFSAFYLGLEMGADGIETDVRMTRDGKLVLFHDGVLDRVTDRSGAFHDVSYEQLKAMKITGKNPDAVPDCIVTLEDFLKYFAFRGLRLAIELKDENIEKEVLALIREYQAEDAVEITSFCFENLRRMRELSPAVTLGYLVEAVDDRVVGDVRSIGGQQLCPKADGLTPELVAGLKEQGFSVRAWGVSDEKVMEKAIACGVDGMTVNFPDKLTEYLRKS